MLTPTDKKHDLPKGVVPVKGDLMDMDSMRAALAGVSTLFLLNAVAADELARALLTLNLANEAGIKRIVYFSMINADAFPECPHAAAKGATETMIAQFGIPATILRPNYFFQNDRALKEPITGHGTYPMPIGGVGVSMVDIRDIAKIVALALLHREKATDPLPVETIEIVGPDVLTGQSVAALWSDVLGKPVAYAGDDMRAFEAMSRAQMPGWMAYDTAMMFHGFQRIGMLPQEGAANRLTAMLGRPLRTYRAFAEETKQQWAQS